MIKKWKEIKQWEYWPSWCFYLPLLPFFVSELIKKGHPYTFYLHVNPSLPLSGHGNESKYRTLELLPSKYIPKSKLFRLDANLTDWLNHGFTYPLIIKPDKGYRGLGVFKINSQEHLIEVYQKELKVLREKAPQLEYIFQEFLQTNEEFAVFTIKNVKTGQFFISSLTQKEFMDIKGDGHSTLKELIWNHPRAKFYSTLYQKANLNLELILGHNETLRLSDIGNHSKGTRFLNINSKIQPELNRTFNNLAKGINGFNYGRFDIKANSLEDLIAGQFKIIELNGIIAEPVHIYDATTMTYPNAIKSLKWHWKQLSDIAIIESQKREKISWRTYLKDIKQIQRNKTLLESSL